MVRDIAENEGTQLSKKVGHALIEVVARLCVRSCEMPESLCRCIFVSGGAFMRLSAKACVQLFVGRCYVSRGLIYVLSMVCA